jgi:RIP metalloprotease RseP
MIGYVEPNGPADKAGIKPGDQIIEPLISTTDPECSKDPLADCGVSNKGFVSSSIRRDTETLLKTGIEKIHLTVKHKGSRSEEGVLISARSLSEVAASEATDYPKGYFGIQPYDYTVQRSTWSAPIVGAGLIAQYSKLTYNALGGSIMDLFKGHGKEASANVSGPIGIFVVLKDGASLGLPYILLIIALLSLTLAIMNTLPIPALDGGKLFVMLLFRLFRKPLTPKLEERIHGTGFAVLMLLFVLITVVDIKRFF